MVTIKTYQNVAQAGYAHSLLEAMGIQGYLHGEDAFLEFPADGIRLQVEEEDVEKALAILDNHEGLVPLPEGFVPPPVVEGEQPADGAE